MANVSHSDLTDPNLHEPKGAAAAAVGKFYIADGAGSGAWKKRLFLLTATLSPAIVATITTAEQTFTVTGCVLATDTLIGVSKPTCTTGVGIAGWRITADNTVGITFVNPTAAGVTPTASQLYSFVFYRA